MMTIAEIAELQRRLAEAEQELAKARLAPIMCVWCGWKTTDIKTPDEYATKACPEMEKHICEGECRKAPHMKMAGRIGKLEIRLRAITSAAQSWHNFHHGTMVQCDSICACLPSCTEALEEDWLA